MTTITQINVTMDTNGKVFNAIKGAVSLLDSQDLTNESGNQRHIASVLIYGVPGVGKTFKVGKAINTYSPKPYKYTRVTAIDFHQRFIDPDDITPLQDIISGHIDYNDLLIIFVDDLEFISKDDSPRCVNLKKDFLSLFKGEPKRARTLLVGASQKPWLLHDDIIKSFDFKVYIGMPDEEERKAMLEEDIRGFNPAFEITPEHIEEVVQRTDGYTPADITVVVRDAAMQPIRKFLKEDENRNTYDLDDPQLENMIPTPNQDDIFTALERSKPSISASEVEQFIQLCQQKHLPT